MHCDREQARNCCPESAAGASAESCGDFSGSDARNAWIERAGDRVPPAPGLSIVLAGSSEKARNAGWTRCMQSSGVEGCAEISTTLVSADWQGRMGATIEQRLLGEFTGTLDQSSCPRQLDESARFGGRQRWCC
jgi:hypothetical protein